MGGVKKGALKGPFRAPFGAFRDPEGPPLGPLPCSPRSPPIRRPPINGRPILDGVVDLVQRPVRVHADEALQVRQRPEIREGGVQPAWGSRKVPMPLLPGPLPG